MSSKAEVFDLVKAAVGLAITRHDLGTDDGELTGDEKAIDEIATDTWNALRGIDTCDGTPAKELSPFMSSQTELGWVIECGPEPLYWVGHGIHRDGFDDDADNAIRFARFQDAEQVRCWLLKENGWAMKSTQHSWS